MSYAEMALKIARQRLSSMDESERRRTSCSGGLKITKQALLGMLGSGKFEKKQVVSRSDMVRDEILEAVDQAEGNLGVASSRLGIKKSSLKRKIQPLAEIPVSYDETRPVSVSRKYLEDNYPSWTVRDFDAKSCRACLEMTSPSGTVTLSVDIPPQFISKT